MKLYYAPGACSLATRISLHEAGLAAEFERVDLKAQVTEQGHDFRPVNPGGYVPVLMLGDGATVTENVAILDLIAQLEPKLGPDGLMARTRLLEMLSYLSTELHAAYKPFWHDAGQAEKGIAAEAVARRFELLDARMTGPFLFGPRFTVADAYLFVMLRWADRFGVRRSRRLLDYFGRILQRDAVRRALAEEELPREAVAAALA